MKLVPKITLAFIAVTAAVMSTGVLRRVRRESGYERTSRERDLSLVAQSMADGAATLWQSQGRDAATAMIAQAGKRDGEVRIRWVCLGTDDTRPQGAVDCASLATSSGANRAIGEGRRYAYVPVTAVGATRGAIEVSASLAPEEGFLRRTIVDSLLITAFNTTIIFALSFLLGLRFVARPTRALVEKARRVGAGSFDEPLVLPGGDEFGELAKEMNAMCAQLSEVHARVKAESTARVAAMEQLRHADRLMTVGKLASGLAHELGTPLNVIEARASMVASGESDGDAARRHAEVVVEQCDRITKIIRQLLTFSRTRGAEKTRSDVKEMARQSVDLLEPIARKKHVALKLSPDEAPAFAAADATELQQALTNLVVNAIQATADGRAVDVAIGCERATPPLDHGGDEAEFVRVSVKDEGCGIPKDQLSHVFEPFFTTKDVGEGTGLGLSVAYGIVRDHGGWIAVESEVGEGSRFTIYLPREDAS